MAVPTTPPSRISKRGDTWEPVTGIITDANGPVDLTGATLRFLAKANINGEDTIIDSSAAGQGACINVEDVDGPGDIVDFEWPPNSGTMIQVPENRGRYRFEMEAPAVSEAGLYEVEIEATKAGAVLTFPNQEEKNPTWQISPDIA